MAKTQRTQTASVTWAQAFRDIIIKAMDKGQLLPILFFFILLGIIFRMPEDKVYDLGLKILAAFQNFSLVGWVLCCVVCILWAGHARIMRRAHSLEYRRIGTEKSRLQNQALSKTTLSSSDS